MLQNAPRGVWIGWKKFDDLGFLYFTCTPALLLFNYKAAANTYLICRYEHFLAK